MLNLVKVLESSWDAVFTFSGTVLAIKQSYGTFSIPCIVCVNVGFSIVGSYALSPLSPVPSRLNFA